MLPTSDTLPKPLCSKGVKEKSVETVQRAVEVTDKETDFRLKLYPDVSEIEIGNLKCTACSKKIVQSVFLKDRPFRHILLDVLMCEKCLDFYGNGEFSTDEDGDDKYCRWCGQGGKLYCCSKCTYTFCKKCVKNNLGRKEVDKLEDEEWKCFVCIPDPLFPLRAQCWVVSEHYLNKRKNQFTRSLGLVKVAAQSGCYKRKSICIEVTDKERRFRQKLYPDVSKVKTENLKCTICLQRVTPASLLKARSFRHIILDVLVCEACLNFYGHGEFSTDADGDEKYCGWCGQGGKLYFCSKCVYAFCRKCVKNNLKHNELKKLEDEDWKCFVCRPQPLYPLRAQCWALSIHYQNNRKNQFTKSLGLVKEEHVASQNRERNRQVVSIEVTVKERQFRQKLYPDVSKIEIENLKCTICLRSITPESLLKGKPFRHVLLDVLVCEVCLDFYGNGDFPRDTDGYDKYCRWCGHGGKLYCCSQCTCTFCKKCVKKNLEHNEVQKLEDEEWHCFICRPEPLYPLRAQCWAVLMHCQNKRKNQSSSSSELVKVEHVANGSCKRKSVCLEVTDEERQFRQKLYPDVLKTKTEKLKCTICLQNIIPSNLLKGRPYRHVVLDVLVCEPCIEMYGDGDFSTDEDGDDKYCRWCGQGGKLYYCSKCSCSFCKKCVKQNLNRSELKKLERKVWNCFICRPEALFPLRAKCWALQEYVQKIVFKPVLPDKQNNSRRKRSVNNNMPLEIAGKGQGPVPKKSRLKVLHTSDDHNSKLEQKKPDKAENHISANNRDKKRPSVKRDSSYIYKKRVTSVINRDSLEDDVFFKISRNSVNRYRPRKRRVEDHVSSDVSAMSVNCPIDTKQTTSHTSFENHDSSKISRSISRPRVRSKQIVNRNGLDNLVSSELPTIPVICPVNATQLCPVINQDSSETCVSSKTSTLPVICPGYTNQVINHNSVEDLVSSGISTMLGNSSNSSYENKVSKDMKAKKNDEHSNSSEPSYDNKEKPSSNESTVVCSRSEKKERQRLYDRSLLSAINDIRFINKCSLERLGHYKRVIRRNKVEARDDAIYMANKFIKTLDCLKSNLNSVQTELERKVKHWTPVTELSDTVQRG